VIATVTVADISPRQLELNRVKVREVGYESSVADRVLADVADLSRLKEWEARYSMLCYEDGTLVDDIFIYRLPASDNGLPGQSAGAEGLIVVNASNREKDFAWLQSFTHGLDVELTDISDETYMLAVQGPRAVGILDGMTDADLASVPSRTAVHAQVGGCRSAPFPGRDTASSARRAR